MPFIFNFRGWCRYRFLMTFLENIHLVAQLSINCGYSRRLTALYTGGQRLEGYRSVWKIEFGKINLSNGMAVGSAKKIFVYPEFD
ncbi:hypothetical protein BIW11_13499 [Tropilaelaps mercedesae]|uniref:Uncharacterized protein n=1 Tax=Tropilaelaps mercedesae TaxID=418985 RepID=A0A1V9X2J5_9ACAR|nr:hypothetical protein BIW11_13499 [Tropilaelaps mercedesae]